MNNDDSGRSDAPAPVAGSRRWFVGRLTLLAFSLPAASALLAACGGGSSSPPTGTTVSSSSSSPSSQPSSSGTPSGTSAAAATTTVKPKTGGTLTVAIASDIIGTDPQGASAGIDRSIYTALYNGLVAPAANLGIVPDLAAKWETPDPQTYVFTLQPNVKFHDGTACDATAVKFNFDWILDPKNASARASEIADLQSVTVVDPQTVKFSLKDVFAPFLSIISDRAGYILSPDARNKYGKDLTHHPVGTGPFQFVEWVKSDHLTLKKFDGYWQSGLPYLDQIIYRPITDSSVALTNLKTNTINFLDNINPSDIASIKSDSSLVYWEGLGVGYTGLWLNTATGPLANQSLRLALSLAIDREALLKVAYFGVGQIAAGPIPPSSWAYDASYPVVKQDLTKAKQALATGEKPNGFTMTLKTDTTPQGSKICQLIQEQIKPVGIDATIQTLDFGALLNAGSAGDFDAMSLGWSGRVDPDGNIQPIFQVGGTFNYGKYKNTTVEQLIGQERTTSDQASRIKIFQQLQSTINDDVAYIFTYFAPTIYASTPAVKGFKVTADGLMRFKETWLQS
ncbi:MAG TPA: ABC transporter substrate-binding protein [Thermomicrobiaceae bacterium]|nr:ABC transporter substrate-binding protein [Thermomicrobiaceae bacterium]